MAGFLPKDNSYTFWGRVVNQANSDLSRRFKDVRNEAQNTVPIEKSVISIRKREVQNQNKGNDLTECYAVLDDKKIIEK